MAITELYASSKSLAVSDSEWSCPNENGYRDTAALSSDGVFQWFVDASALAASDVIRLRVYEKVLSSGVQRIVYESVMRGVQSEPVWVSPSLILMNGWDMTLQSISGTISVNWSIRQVA